MELSSIKPHPRLVALLGQCVGERYVVERMLAVGGMAAVFRGCQETLGRPVAIKVLLPELEDQQDCPERFEQEVELLCRLDHPHCVRLLDAGTTACGLPYLVTEFVDGRELGEVVRAPLPPERAGRIALQLLDVLEHAHAQGVVHRDLKPANILVTPDRNGNDSIKVLDFGVSKDLRNGTSSRPPTDHGVVYGTPGYMSPEQASAKPLDHRSDLYAVGILLVFMLSGHAPFDAGSAEEIVRAQRKGDIPALPSSVPASLQDVVRGLLAAERDARFGSARAASDALRHALEASAMRAPEAPDLDPDAEPVGSHLPARIDQPSAPTERALSSFGPSWFLGSVSVGALALALAVVGVVRRLGTDPQDVQRVVDAAPKVTLETVDGVIARGDLQHALGLIDEMIGNEPTAAALWRKGHVVSKLGHVEDALELYAQALEDDPGLVEEPQFFVELRELMAVPELEPSAIEIALSTLEHHGHDFLVERVNRKEAPLDYVTRHRILDALAGSEAADRVDSDWNLELDVHQAGSAGRPCVAFAQTLAKIEDRPDPRFIAALSRTDPPAKVVADEAEVCAKLPALRERLLVVRPKRPDVGGPR